MSILGAAITALDPKELEKLVKEYAPVIEAVVRFLETHHDEKVRAESMDKISRGMHFATQTGDTSQLESSLRQHCLTSGTGCRVQ